jgi:hypothetical protein
MEVLLSDTTGIELSIDGHGLAIHSNSTLMHHNLALLLWHSGLLHQYIWWSAVASKLTNSQANARSGVTR